jgi:DNA ligase 4
MQDAEAEREEGMMYSNLDMTEEELNEKYPNRPHNRHRTLPFHVLFTTLFNPLNDIRKKPSTGPLAARRKVGTHGPQKMSPFELRKNIIDRFISRWKSEVGNDIYPAFRLIIPEQDRDRAMYGLKEKLIAKLLVRVMGINKNSMDAESILNWKIPGLRASVTAGDFAARCFEVISKRPILTKVGDMSIAEVNAKLDILSMESKEEGQLPLFEEFYRRMNPEELMWLIRIILRQMKVGATEKTWFHSWHADAESLFNVSSSLRRVCWELYDPKISLHSDQSQITLMQCFQPQLAAFQLASFEQILIKMRPTEDEKEFWIEEKMDGERMQMHMMQDSSVPGGFRFSFWSRKAKDYTYLYGNGLRDPDSSLTKYLKDAFKSSVRNIILDGEMIVWDIEQDSVVPFGHLKTAALDERKNPFSNMRRPCFKIFDCLYLNDTPITKYTLRDRRKALEASVNPISTRFEIHKYTTAMNESDIEDQLRKVIAESSEGLVIKSPRSNYRLNERNDDWIKVKPEYMDEFGEDLDCVVIGGYYGSGHRGGRLSSFLCGLKPEANQRRKGVHEQFCWSFFKVGGGFTANDYSKINYLTAGKWKKWDPKMPPSDIIELGGGDKQFERPDVWIMPEDSIVVSVKAASVHTTTSFRTGMTLRFPRFSTIREDKDWKTALTTTEFAMLRNNAEKEHKEKFRVNDERKKKRMTIKRKKVLTFADGVKDVKNPYGGPDTRIFDGLTFFVVSGASIPEAKSKPELEEMIKINGGKVVQAQTGDDDLVVIGEKRTLKVTSIEKQGKLNIVKPSWLFDCIAQSRKDVGRPAFLLPYEPAHMYFTRESDRDLVATAVDEYGDSYCRDLTVAGLRKVCKAMKMPYEQIDQLTFLEQLNDLGIDTDDLPGNMFRRVFAYFDQNDDVDGRFAETIICFLNGRVAKELEEAETTHIIVGKNCTKLDEIRAVISRSDFHCEIRNSIN